MARNWGEKKHTHTQVTSGIDGMKLVQVFWSIHDEQDPRSLRESMCMETIDFSLATSSARSKQLLLLLTVGTATTFLREPDVLRTDVSAVMKPLI